MLGLSTLLLLLAALGDGAAILRRDDPSPEVKKALGDAGVDVSKQVAKPKNVSCISPFQSCTLKKGDMMSILLRRP